MNTQNKQELPKWFTGELYTEGEEVTNRFGGGSIELTAVELSMYDFIIGASMVAEMYSPEVNGVNNPQMVKDLRKGLDWFRMNNAEAYMVLLD